MNPIIDFFHSLYSSLVDYRYSRKGYRDCRRHDVKIDTNNINSTRAHFEKVKYIVDPYNPDKHTVFEALEEGLLSRMKNSVLSLNNKHQTYDVKALEDRRDIITKQNVRNGTIEQYFKDLNTKLQTNTSRLGHKILILLIFGIDGIISVSIFETVFRGTGMNIVEIYFIAIGVFVVVLSMLLMSLGAYFKKRGRWRWPAVVPFVLIFAFLTFIRVNFVVKTSRSFEGLTTQDTIAVACVFFTIYCLTAFLAVYLSYRDTYKDNAALCSVLDQEYSQRKKISSNLERWPALMEIKARAYRKGWKQRIERNEQKLEDLVRKVGGDPYVL